LEPDNVGIRKMIMADLQKVQGEQIANGEELSALVEPRPGHSDNEVISALEKSGAAKVTALAPGFISVQAKMAILRAIEAIAYVHIKSHKTVRSYQNRG
jgi:hypothetical protein